MSGQPSGVADPGAGLLALYDAALPQVYGYLLSRCGQRALAEDLTAETFLAAVDAVRRVPPATVSVAVAGRRRPAQAGRPLAPAGPRGAQPAARSGEPRDRRRRRPVGRRLDAVTAREVLGRLGPHHRLALTLRYLDGLPVPEVARLLDRTLHATEALLVRARAAFRRAYDGRPGEGGPR